MQTMSAARTIAGRRMRCQRRPLLPRMCDKRPSCPEAGNETIGAGEGGCEEGLGG